MNVPAHTSRPPGCLSDFTLDQLIARELSGEAEQAARRHTADCPRCAERLVQFEAVEAPPLDPALARPQSNPKQRALSWALLAAIAMGAGGSLLLVRSRSGSNPSASIVEMQTRTKAAIGLALIVRGASGEVRRLAPGDTVHPGDALRFEVAAGEPGFVSIIGIDAAGAITKYAPQSEASLRFENGPATLLGDTIIADDTLGAERVLALLCREPLAYEALRSQVERALKRAGGDPHAVAAVDARCAEAAFDIAKRRDP